jgi:type VI protein secretion system component VasF
MMAAGEEEFLRRVREGLDAGAGALDAATVMRLRRARAHAIEAAGGRARRVRGWVPAAAAAGVAVLAVWIGWSASMHRHTPASAAAARLDAVEVLAGGANLDLYENLDFYAWLANGSGHG